MTKVFLAIILVLFIVLSYATSDAAKWEYLASSGVYAYYYDEGNIRHLSEVTVQIILKQTYEDKDAVNQFYQKYASDDNSIKLEDYSISTMVINCIDKIVGVKSIISYKESGEVILQTNFKNINYLFIPSGSIYEALYDKVC